MKHSYMETRSGTILNHGEISITAWDLSLRHPNVLVEIESPLKIAIEIVDFPLKMVDLSIVM